ncbi:MAG: hypothetical protein ACTSWW_09460 [Promethearchaeota archaeon]
MDLPFLEISIETTREETLSSSDLLTIIQKSLNRDYGLVSQLLQPRENPCLRFDFKSKEEFERMYEKNYKMYEFLYDNILRDELLFDPLFEASSDQSIEEAEEDNGADQNYIVLKYHSNYLAPMRRSYGLTSRINRMLGANLFNEEISGGFLRFLKTKEDFEGMLLPARERWGWEEWFRIRNVDLTHPTVQSFLKIVDELDQKEV